MKRALRGLMWVMLSTALVVMAPRALAQRPPDQAPVDVGQDFNLSWDRSAVPSMIELVPQKTVIANDRTGLDGYGKLFYTCVSSADTQQGRCPTSDTMDPAANRASTIALQFREKRSGMRIDVDVEGELLRIQPTAACFSDYWDQTAHYLWSSQTAECNFRDPAGTALGLRIQQRELEKLVAGHWVATLSIDLRKPPSQLLLKNDFRLELAITDRDAVAIYFPQFDEIAPHVGMNLRYDPIAQTVGGGTTVDMCLYDGLGSQAAYLGVTVRDSGARAPGPLGFSAWHRDSGGSGDSERLDYTVTLDHSGALIPMRNGIEEQLTGIDSAKLKLVLLPGMSQPVFCVHTPLRLNMPRVPIAEKQPGYYRGDLKVELRVPTGVP
ncbi:CfaE/CblD family pilus tip adhesin [Stenotrophomonas sp. ESTM1D_MKCIP4_1]|uniref:CfaE/CblD family pilus tip adhesin n=1 Tax=Stenotrophomonas sp. ESTM1D_MKCIP4_1 TaxID=2072414 RepID=UPI0020B13823|nr:CfaE/CblD family pilus tip adhesin [Stenotrophomonas sp. ESTM1D_MKCIP4_1]